MSISLIKSSDRNENEGGVVVKYESTIQHLCEQRFMISHAD